VTSRVRAILAGTAPNPWQEHPRKQARPRRRSRKVRSRKVARGRKPRLDAAAREASRFRERERERVAAYFRRTGLLPKAEALAIFRALQAARAAGGAA
jgi:hypothetical protein